MKNVLYSIIVPTRDEEENIMPFLYRIRNVLASNVRYELIFIDDSDDGTHCLLEKEMEQDRHVRIIHRLPHERDGLAGAFVTGFREARGEFLCCLDADLQHPPETIPLLLGKIQHGDDIAVASRYARGGSAEGLGSMWRKTISRATKYLSYIILPITRATSDPGSGFFAFRRGVVSGIILRPRGFKILIELLVRGRHEKVSDVPYHFLVREHAISKATFKQGVQFLRHLWFLYWHPATPLQFENESVIGNPGASRKPSFPEFVNKNSSIFSSAWPFIRMLNSQVQGRFITRFGPIVTLVAIIALMAGVPVIINGGGILSLRTYLTFFVSTLSPLLTLQGVFSLMLMLYAWEDPLRAEQSSSPGELDPPSLSFSAIIPARHEELVIGDTIRAIARIRYPESKKEVLVICRIDDTGTIAAAKDVIRALPHCNIRLVQFDGGPINKPHSLNIGLEKASNNVVVIFDAEDEPHPDIYRMTNTILCRERVDVVQSGVQLMNYRSRWFTSFNVLEYFFWFKSSLHFFSDRGFMPLGGNTVFFRREWLDRVGGWDERCLTEDADIGIRLSAAGARMRVVYDAEHATQEEAPTDVGSFIRQRTRWNQGFLQIFFKGDWLRLPRISQKFLAGFTLLWPEIQGLLFLYIPFALFMMFKVKMPVVLALFSVLPLYLLVFQQIVNLIGFYEFTKAYKKQGEGITFLKILFLFYPYQMLLGFSAGRALYRSTIGQMAWEKTAHSNAHRRVAPAPALRELLPQM